MSWSMHVTHELVTLEDEGLIRRVEDHEQTYLFKHILTQETAYASLLRKERREWHRLIAATCETLFADNLNDYLPLLAYHFTEAGDNRKAVSYWYQYGERALQISAFPEALKAFQNALMLLPNEPTSEGAQIYAQLGELYCRHTDYDLAKENFRNALSSGIAVGAAKTTATALTGIARIESQRGDHQQARELGEEALRWAKDANDVEAIAHAHRQLGVAYNYEGKNDLAEEHLQAGLALYQQLNDREGISSCLNSLGVVARDKKKYDLALSYIEQALALSQQLGDRYGVSIRLVNLGVIAEQRGDYQTAARCQDEALAISQEIGDREGAALIRLNLGSLALTRGDSDLAMQQYHQALAAARELGLQALSLYIIAAIAKVELALGNAEYAAELLGLAFRHPAGTADIKIDFDSVLQELKTRLAQEELDAAMDRGETMDLAHAVERILQQDTLEKNFQ